MKEKDVNLIKNKEISKIKKNKKKAPKKVKVFFFEINASKFENKFRIEYL